MRAPFNITPGTGHLCNSLGITDARSNEIMDVVEEAANNGANTSTTLKNIYDRADLTDAEMVFAIFMSGVCDAGGEELEMKVILLPMESISTTGGGLPNLMSSKKGQA